MQKYRFQIPFSGNKEVFLELEIHKTVSFLFCWDQDTLKSESLDLPHNLEEIENLITNLEIVQDVSFPEGIAILLGFSLFKVCNSSANIISNSNNVIAYISKIKEYLDNPSIKYQDFYTEGLNEYQERFRKLNLHCTNYRLQVIKEPSDFIFMDETRTIKYKNQLLEFTDSTVTYDRLKCLVTELLRRKKDPDCSLPDYILREEAQELFEKAGLGKLKQDYYEQYFTKKSGAEKINVFATFKKSKFSLL